jgi:predicted amidohydrolase
MRLVLLNPTLRAHDTRHNLGVIESLAEGVVGGTRPDDVLLLPEQFTFDDNKEAYAGFLGKIANIAGCTIVGGSHHREVEGKRVNTGIVFDAGGNEIATYSKLRPYFSERNIVSPGEKFGEFSINGKNFLVVICADFWYSDILLRASVLPDVILVPSLSVSRKPGAEYSRSLWHHLAIARAYEFGVFVGISDWGEDSVLPPHRTCGVGGLADPTSLDPPLFFQPVSEAGVSIFNLDFQALEEFRADRRLRGFFWK